MRIALITYGSRGDVQPFLALGSDLARRGHAVTLIAPERFAPEAAALGMASVALPGDLADLSRRLVETGEQSLPRMIAALYRHAMTNARAVMLLSEPALATAEVIVSSFLTLSLGEMAAARFGSRHLIAQFFPMFVHTREYPSMLSPRRSLGPLLNAASHAFSNAVFRHSQYLGYRTLLRANPDLPRQRFVWATPGERTPLLLAWSPSLLPHAADYGPKTYTTGAWRSAGLAAGYQPAPEVAAFLANGPAPIFIGFGSMISPDPARLSAALIEGVQRSGQRAVVQRGWAGLGHAALPPEIMLIDEMPHEWLFAQCNLLVHHCGAGTTTTASAAGKPQIPVPFTADQPFWAARLQRLGVASAPLDHRRFSAEDFAAALRAADQPAVRARATQLGAALNAEDGIAAARALILGEAPVLR